MSKEYKALKNFIHNTCGIDRNEIKSIVREIITDIAKQELLEYFKTNDFIRKIVQRLHSSRYHSIDEEVRQQLSLAINKIWTNYFNENYTFDLRKKENDSVEKI